MKHGSVLQKTFHSVLSVLYLSLSFYVITCAFHHDPLTHLHADHQVHHADGQETNSSHEPAADDALFCKFVQKVSGSVVLASVPATSLLAVSHYETFFSDFSALGSVSGTHPSRAPPILILT